MLGVDKEKTAEINKGSRVDVKDQKRLFSCTRMLPPGKVHYYYSVKEEKQLNNNQPVSGSDEYSELKVPKSNYIDNIVQYRQPVTKSYLVNMKCIPRPPPVLLDGREDLKTPWDFYKSVFQTYKFDN